MKPCQEQQAPFGQQELHGGRFTEQQAPAKGTIIPNHFCVERAVLVWKRLDGLRFSLGRVAADD